MSKRPAHMFSDWTSPDFAGALNLFAHPLAGAAAASALSLGFACQMMGAWAGAVTAANDVARRAVDEMSGAASSESLRKQRLVAVKAKSAAAAVMAEAHQAAERVAAGETLTKDAVRQSEKPAVAKPASANSVTRPAARTSHARQALPKTGASPTPRRSDDLKQLAGVGPKLESMLNGLGIRTYAQVAAWGPADIEAIETALGLSGRVERDGWVQQAKALARGRKTKD